MDKLEESYVVNLGSLSTTKCTSTGWADFSRDSLVQTPKGPTSNWRNIFCHPRGTNPPPSTREAKAMSNQDDTESPFYGQNGRLFPYPDLAYTRRRGSHSTLGGSFLHALRHSRSPPTSSALRPSPNLARRFSATVAFTRCPPAKHCSSHAFSVSSTNT